VQWRVGSTNKKAFEAGKAAKRRGQPLCYIDARDVMQRLDAVCGPFWQALPIPMNDGIMATKIGILFDEHWIWRGDGASPTGDVTKENSREMAIKGGFSDALKRGGVLWGIGRYLYDVGTPWVELDEWWSIPKDTLPQLKGYLMKAAKAPPPKAVEDDPLATDDSGTDDGGDALADSDEPNPRDVLIEALGKCTTLAQLGALWKKNQRAIITWPKDWQTVAMKYKDACKQELSDAG
jgi:hypothetical protein